MVISGTTLNRNPSARAEAADETEEEEAAVCSAFNAASSAARPPEIEVDSAEADDAGAMRG